jgi:uncharacterized repeat protein (TIGR02543 family)
MLQQDGTAYITGQGTNLGTLIRVNLSNGNLAAGSVKDTDQDIMGLSRDPSTGIVWASVYSSRDEAYLPGLYKIDVQTGQMDLSSQILQNVYGGQQAWDITFDSSGRLWMITWGDHGTLVSIDPDAADPSSTFFPVAEVLSSNNVYFGSDAIWIPGAGTTSAPTITSISPTTGPTAGGTSITITGTGFVAGATVTVGGSSCTSVVVVSATSITCLTPVATTGAKDVVVTNTDTGTATSTGSFTYAKAFRAVTFKANGGTGTLANASKNVASALPANTFVRTGYVFKGWNTRANGTGTAYADRTSYSFESDLTLHAQWTAVANSGPKLKKYIGIFIGDDAFVTYSMKSVIRAWAKKLPKDANITCVGSTSGSKVTAFDTKLATSRAKNVCAELVKVRSDVKYTLKANPSSSIKSPSKNVWIYQK